MSTANGSIPESATPGRAEFAALEGRVTSLEWRADHTDGRVLGVDGAEQDLREQLRSLRNEIAQDRKADAEFRAAMLARIPPAWTQKTIVSFMVAVAMALLSKALGVPLPELSP